MIAVKLPQPYVDALDDLVRKGRFSSRSEAIRVAVRELLIREKWFEEEPRDGWDNEEGNFREEI